MSRGRWTAARSCRLVLVAAVLGAVCSAGWAGVAGAQSGNSSGVAARITAGVDGSGRADLDVPVTVSVKSERLLRARIELELSAEGFGLPATTQTVIDVEVPAGATKTFSTILNDVEGTQAEMFGFGFGMDMPLTVSAVVRGEDGKRITQAAANLQPKVGVRVGVGLGVIPADRDLPKSFTVVPKVDRGDGLFVGDPKLEDAIAAGIPEAQTAPVTALFGRINQAGGALAPFGAYDQIVLAPGDFDRLSGGWRQGLLAWVTDGGILTIDGPAGALGTGAPQAWADGSARAGAGAVLFSDGAAARGDWKSVVVPADQAAAAPGMDIDRSTSNSASGLLAIVDLAKSSGFEVPPVRTQLLAVAGYILLVGPIMFLVLNRVRRQVAAWVLIPALAVLATGAVWVVGVGLRDQRDNSATAYMRLGEGFSEVMSWVGTPSSGNAAIDIRFPAGSTVYGQVDNQVTAMFGGGPERAKIPTIVSSRSGVTFRPVVSRNGLGVSQAVTTSKEQGRLEIDASVDVKTGNLKGTVTNRTPHDLEDVVVATPGGLMASVGNVASGKSADFALTATSAGANRQQGFGGALRFVTRQWGLADQGMEMIETGAAPEAGDRPAAPAIEWLNSMLRTEGVGSITAAGWASTTSLVDVTVNGDKIDDEVEVLVSDVGSPAPYEALDLVPLSTFDGERSVWLGLVGDSAANTDTYVVVPSVVATAPEVWNGDAWVPLTDALEIPRRVSATAVQDDPGATVGEPAEVGSNTEPPVAVTAAGAAPSGPATTLAPDGSVATTVPSNSAIGAPTASELFPRGRISGAVDAGPLVTRERDGGFGFPYVDWPEPRPSDNDGQSLRYPNLNLWRIPPEAIVDGKVFLNAPGGTDWRAPVELVAVPRA